MGMLGFVRVYKEETAMHTMNKIPSSTDILCQGFDSSVLYFDYRDISFSMGVETGTYSCMI
jgi:hypothetical protein